MKKNIIIVIAGILLLIMLSLFYTYAINVSMEQVDGNADLTYNINLSNPTSTIITVEPGETKYFDIVVTNTNDGAINYGLVYNQVEINTVTVAQTDVSKYKAIDSIEKDETRRISLVIKNDKTSNITYSILPVTGYEEGGDLIVPSNHTIIDDVYSYKSGTITGSVHDYVPSGGSSGGSTGGDSGGGDSGDAGTNLDTSNANTPDLVEGLIPVMYNGSKWVKASSSNSDSTYKWYDYNDKQWANAVLVSSSNRTTYKTAAIGTEIPESDVLAYYVWIPRYKYKVWNIKKTINSASYTALTTGIDIVFESETATTGTITCSKYNFTVIEGNGLSETCTGSNGDYYTHPGFWWDTDGDDVRESGEELRGIWVAKFQVSPNSSSTCYSAKNATNCNLTTIAPRFKPNENIWTYNNLTNFQYAYFQMIASGNEYGLDSSTTDTHMLKNSEWGSIAYLTNSIYGRCNGTTCDEVSINSVNPATAGCGPQSAGSNAEGTTCNAYNTDLGKMASTTGNIYGIYDVSGGAYEYIFGNIGDEAGSYAYFQMNGGTNFTYSATTAKYINTYAYGSSYGDQNAYNRTRLGDATGEVVLAEQGMGGWYGDYSIIPFNMNMWQARGASYADANYAGLFAFSSNTGGYGQLFSTRGALIKP